MGCGSSSHASQTRPAQTGEKVEKPVAHPPVQQGTVVQNAQPVPGNSQDSQVVTNNNTAASSGGPATRRGNTPQELMGCKAGKDRHMSIPCLRVCDQDGKLYYLACYCNDFTDLSGISIVCRTVSGTVWMRSMTDEEVETWKETSQIQLAWPAFWRSLNAAFVKSEPPRAIATTGNKRRLDIPLRTKDQRLLIPIELANCGSEPELTHQHFFLPFLTSYHKRKLDPPPNEAVLDATEGKINLLEVTASHEAEEIEGQAQELDHLRTQAKDSQAQQVETTETVDRMEKQVRKAIKFCEHGREVHHLDALYNEGGARTFQHIPWAVEHDPVYVDTRDEILNILVEKYESVDGSSVPKSIVPTDPRVMEILQGVQDQATVWRVLESLDKLDENDFDAFELDDLTKGGSLLHTAWAITFRYGLCEYFGIEKTILYNFWMAVTAGYHSNPYHNSIHAADVLQYTHYIIGPGKMGSLMRMKKEDELACTIAAGIHDYDHPGFNNLFHTKTSAYLGVLYNDRSILENHHCSCVFELMRHPKFNILASLSDDQKKEVRDIIVELLLSTDMGNHAKIFNQFRRRAAENPDWYSRREDVKLGMVMAIKMADIGNCSRPKSLYLRWADRIAEEFYAQGDVEKRLNLSVSPFMDRKKHAADFSKGQMSFMNYIVLPMFDDVAQLLPSLQHLVTQCTSNRSIWTPEKAEGENQSATNEAK
eukprot:TRINITY_DN17721_c0_g2_i1.p1 TRINITY_DN17721_c0_g2~~TRINITY_DN17721_c0_g2_i1.p1  ORF type:complete len:707 (+),score=225.19 TRINITY_DN17721_c0_g2_i1:248-2368(+)